MGTVYYADPPSGPPVAVKVIQARYVAVENFRQRFLEEIENVRQIQQFCTAAVLDHDTGQTPYLVTEYIDGPDLQRQIADGETLGENDVTRFAIGVATALWAIHNAGVVHRDLKPSNVLLARQGPLVIDFGVASAIVNADRDRAAGPTVPQWLTPAFMAPEQALRARHGTSVDVSAPADIFAWAGVVLFAATGRAPFGKGGFLDLVDKVLGEPPNLEGLPRNLVDVVSWALAKDPAHRPTARELLASLVGDAQGGTAQAARAGQAEAGRGWETTTVVEVHGPQEPVRQDRAPDQHTGPPRHFQRRRRVVAAGAIAALLLLLLGLAPPWSPVSPWHHPAQIGACATVSVYTGDKGSPYYAYGTVLQRNLHKQYPGTDVHVDATDGTEDNLNRLQDADGSRCALAITQLNTDVDARNGVGHFEGKSQTDLRTVAPLWLDVAHLMVLADSDITTPEQLCGRTVTTGLTNSGSAQIGKVLFENVLECNKGMNRPNKLADALTELGQGKVSAVFWAGGAPTQQIVDAIRGDLKLRMLPLGAYLQRMATNWNTFYSDKLRDKFVYGQVYQTTKITDRDYPGMAPTETFGVPNGIVANKYADNDLIAFTVQEVFDHRADYETALWGSTRGERRFFSAAQSVSASSLYCLVPLASEAEKYYKKKEIAPRCDP